MMASYDLIGRGTEFFPCADGWLSAVCKWLRAAAAALEVSGEASMARILRATASAPCGATSPVLWLQLSLLTLAFSLLASSTDGPNCHLRSSRPAAAQQRSKASGACSESVGVAPLFDIPACPGSVVVREAGCDATQGSHIQRSPLSMGAFGFAWRSVATCDLQILIITPR